MLVGKERSSNFELLRIFAMLLIVAHHFALHGTWPGGGIPGSDLVLQLFTFGGKLGVDLFVLITGYMSIKSRFKLKSLIRVVLQTFFYSVVILICFLLLDPSAITDKRHLLMSLLPTTSGLYWFCTAYAGLLLVSPFLKKLILALEERGTRKLTLMLLVLLSLVPTLTGFKVVGSDFAWFGFLYILASYIRLWGTAFTTRRILLFMFVPFVLVLVVNVALSAIKGERLASYVGLESTFLLVMAIGVFKWFEQLEIGAVKPINLLASGAFAVYLVHDNWLIRSWLWPHFAFVYDLGGLAVLAAGVGAALGIYLCCALLDLARHRFIEAPVMSLLSKGTPGSLMGRFDQWLNDV